MAYSTYEDWIETGKAWPKKIPRHWELKKFRFLFKFGRGLGITKSDLLEEGVPCVNYGEIHSQFGFEVIPEQHDLKCVDDTNLETGIASLLNDGDFVFADTSEDVEGSGNFTYLNSKTPAFAGYHTVIARPTTNNSSRFLAYLFDSKMFRFQIRKNVSGVKVYSITQDILKDCRVWLPPIEEQEKIVQFLDYKTHQIDQLIEKKKELIEKLDEQRIALITQAVTKGVNEKVKMKHSGIEWLGEVPEHWEIMQFKDRCRVVSGQVDPTLPEYEILPLIAPDHIEKGSGKLLETKTAKEQGAISGKYIFSKGDLLYSKIRPELNKICIAPSQGLCSADMYAIRTENGLSLDFLFYLMLSRYFHQYAILESMRVAMPKINREALGQFKILVPPLDEQNALVAKIKTSLTKIEDSVAVSKRSILILEEYRLALINSAVTGKIDISYHGEKP